MFFPHLYDGPLSSENDSDHRCNVSRPGTMVAGSFTAIPVSGHGCSVYPRATGRRDEANCKVAS